MCNVYNPSIQKVRNAVEVSCSSQCWSGANTYSEMLYCVTNHFCALVNDYIFVVMIKCFAPLHVGHVQNRLCNALMCGKPFLCSCVYDRFCVDHESAIN